MSKTLEKLVEKAQEKGFAKINGRMRDFQYVGPLEEKYAIKVKDNTVTLRHWGTVTLKINTVTKEVIDVYGESVSDRDSVNFVLDYFNVPYHTHFYPSRSEFELHQDYTEKVITVI